MASNGDMDALKNIRITALNPGIEILQGPAQDDGTPSWVLYNPVSNKYFRIGWAEYECLARFNGGQDIDALIRAVRNETTLSPAPEDIAALFVFLKRHGFIPSSAADRPSAEPHWLSRLLHGYLFFTIPLFKPQATLNRAMPYAGFLYTRGFFYFWLLTLCAGVFLTLPRLDEFMNTFMRLWSPEGLAIMAIAFVGIKVIHECAHALTAARHGVYVPHMGLAFMVLYPMLYTETTGAWRLKSRFARMQIGLAGVAAELVIAAGALIGWHMLPPASLGQAICFSAVIISLAGSLLINLNPLMRFDGYYVLSDALGIENLHKRATDFARWHLRRLLFAFKDASPEMVPAARQRFMIAFGYAVIVYRFFLFLGIALLVYHVFFKPLGLILMMVEIYFFIMMPALSEFVIWLRRRGDIFNATRGRLVMGALGMLVIAGFVPWQTSAHVPAMRHAAQFQMIYAPAPSAILQVGEIAPGALVRQGDLLVALQSNELSRDIAREEARLKGFETLARRSQSNIAIRQKYAGLDNDIETLKSRLKALREREAQLVIHAAFDGVITDVNPDIHARRFIRPDEPILSLVGPGQAGITGYLDEAQLRRMGDNPKAEFFPDATVWGGKSSEDIHFVRVDTVAAKTLDWPDLSSVYGGAIAADPYRDPAEGEGLVPRTSHYRISFTQDTQGRDVPVTERGVLVISAKAQSPVMRVLRGAYDTVLREIGFN